MANSKYPLPTAASLLVCHDCNLGCLYCFEKHQKKTMSEEVVIESLYYLARNAKAQRADSFHVILFGGEPTMVPQTLEQVFRHGVRISREIGIPFTANMITNATIMNDKLYNILEKYKDQVHFEVQLSVDGIKEIQDKNRITKDGHGTYDKVVENIKIYQKLFGKGSNKLSIHGCLNRESLPYLYRNFLHFREDLGIPRVWFLVIQEEEWQPGDVDIYRSELGKIHDWILEKVKAGGNIEEVKNYAPIDRCLKPRSSRPLPCDAGRGFVTITADGEIYPCHQIYFNDPNKETLIGDVFNGVDDMKRKLFLDYEEKDLGCPSSCEHYNCYRCLAVNWVWNGSVLSQMRGMYCELSRVELEFQRKMKEELISMGLLNNFKDDYSSGDACLCNVRSNENLSQNTQPGNNPKNPACLCDSRGDQVMSYPDGCEDGKCDCKKDKNVKNNLVEAKAVVHSRELVEAEPMTQEDKDEILAQTLNLILEKQIYLEKLMLMVLNKK